MEFCFQCNINFLFPTFLSLISYQFIYLFFLKGWLQIIISFCKHFTRSIFQPFQCYPSFFSFLSDRDIGSGCHLLYCFICVCIFRQEELTYIVHTKYWYYQSIMMNIQDFLIFLFCDSIVIVWIILDYCFVRICRWIGYVCLVSTIILTKSFIAWEA